MDRLELLLEQLSTRFDNLDQKNQSVDVQVINSIGSLIDRIAGIETVQANILFKIEAVEKGQTNLETFVNGELSNNVKSIMETVKKNNASQNGFAAAVEAVGKEMAVTKEVYEAAGICLHALVNPLPRKKLFLESAILSRISNMQTQSYNDLKPQSNSVSEPLHKPIHRTGIAPCQTTPPLPQKQSSVHLLKSLRRRMVPCVQILYNYDGPHIKVKKGEIFGLLEDSSDQLWKIGRDGKTDFVPRTCCQKIDTRRSFGRPAIPRMMDVEVPI